MTTIYKSGKPSNCNPNGHQLDGAEQTFTMMIQREVTLFNRPITRGVHLDYETRTIQEPKQVKGVKCAKCGWIFVKDGAK